MSKLFFTKKYHPSARSGFTIVETTLAMAFIAVLFLTIVMLILSVISIYQKGLAIKAVNTSGRALVDDISRAIISSVPKSTDSLCQIKYSVGSIAYNNCKNDGGYYFIYHQNYSNQILINGTTSAEPKPLPTRGVLCTGRYSYLWNSGYTFPSSNYTVTSGDINDYRFSLINADDTSQRVNDFRLLRVLDTGNSVCSSGVEGTTYALAKGLNSINDSVSVPASIYNSRVELLPKESTDNLAIYDLAVFRPEFHQVTNQAFYSGTFTLATIQGGVDITGNGEYCTEKPDNLNTDFAYCAINKFNFAARARGEQTYDEQSEFRSN